MFSYNILMTEQQQQWPISTDLAWTNLNMHWFAILQINRLIKQGKS